MPGGTQALEHTELVPVAFGDRSGLAPRPSLLGAVRRVIPDGVDTALELVGTPTLPETLRATRVHGMVCFTGMLSNQWTMQDLYPIEYLPRGVRLTA